MWFKQQKIYLLTILEAKSELKVSVGSLSSEVSFFDL